LAAFAWGNHALVFVWLAHDRQFVGAILVLLVVFVLVRMISGRRLTIITKGFQSIKLVENSTGMRGVMLLLLRGKASSKQSRCVSAGLSQHFIQL
jgi:hypothetical protein